MENEFEQLSHQMFETMSLMRRLGLKIKKDQHGLHHGKGHVLHVLLEHDHLSQAQLAQIIDIRPASVTGLLEKMEKEKLVIRTQDEHDRRVTRVSISGEGRKLFRENQIIRQQIDQLVFGALTNDEQHQLANIFTKLLKTMNYYDKQDRETFARAINQINAEQESD